MELCHAIVHVCVCIYIIIVCAFVCYNSTVFLGAQYENSILHIYTHCNIIFTCTCMYMYGHTKA